LLKKTINTKPKDATHWSCRDFAGETGASKSTVQRVWSSFGIKPHRSRSFKLSTDPFFVEKVRDILGLLPWSPGQRARSVCGRKEPMPGLGAQSARPSHGPWISGRLHPRLSPAWNNDPVCRFRCCHGYPSIFREPLRISVLAVGRLFASNPARLSCAYNTRFSYCHPAAKRGPGTGHNIFMLTTSGVLVILLAKCYQFGGKDKLHGNSKNIRQRSNHYP
jgi:hypothetical protein